MIALAPVTPVPDQVSPMSPVYTPSWRGAGGEATRAPLSLRSMGEGPGVRVRPVHAPGGECRPAVAPRLRPGAAPEVAPCRLPVGPGVRSRGSHRGAARPDRAAA